MPDEKTTIALMEQKIDYIVQSVDKIETYIFDGKMDLKYSSKWVEKLIIWSATIGGTIILGGAIVFILNGAF